MSFVHGKTGRVLYNGYDLSAYLSDVSAAQALDTAEVSVLSDDKQFVAGQAGGSISANGFFDGDAAAIDAVLAAIFGADATAVLTYAPFGHGAAGRRAKIAAVNQTSYEVAGGASAAVSVSAEFQANGGVHGGIFLADLAARTASGNGTAQDNTALSSNGGRGSLHITAYSGFTSVTVKVQHSTDSSSWADLGTFVAATAIGGQYLEVASGTTVNRYLRYVVTVVGSGSVTFAVAFARR